MQINPLTAAAMANTNSSSTTSGTSSTNSSSSTDSNDPLASTDNMFITLLSAQLENQTPFDPVDPMQFTDELVQFNMLDQLTQINNTLQQMSGVTPSSSTDGDLIAATQGGN